MAFTVRNNRHKINYFITEPTWKTTPQRLLLDASQAKMGQTRSEEIQSHHRESPGVKIMTLHGSNLPAGNSHPNSSMEEDRIMEDQIMTDQPNIDHMIYALCDEVAEENGDNKDVLDDEDLLVEDLKLLEVESKKSRRLSAPHMRIA